MNIELFVQYFLGTAILFDASIAWFVLLKNPKRAVNQAYFFMVFWITIWQVGNYLTSYVALTSNSLLFATRLLFAAAALMVVTLFYFVWIFPDRSHHLFMMKILFPPAALLVIISLSNFLIVDAQQLKSEVILEDIEMGAIYYFYTFCILSLLCISFVTLIYRWITTESSYERIQFQYFTLALITPVLLAGFTNLYLPYSAFSSGSEEYRRYFFQNIGPASTIFLSSITAYAILRHRLMDMRVIIYRNTISVLVSLVLFFFLFGGFILVGDLFSFSLTIFDKVLIALLLILIIFGFPPARGIIEKAVKRFIKREMIDLRVWSDQQQAVFRRATNPFDFARFIVSEILQHVPVESVHVVYYDHPSRSLQIAYPPKEKRVFALDEPWVLAITKRPRLLGRKQAMALQDPAVQKSFAKVFSQFHADYLLPLKAYHRLLGAVFVGQRIDGTDFSKEDQYFLIESQRLFAKNLWSVLQIHYAVYQKLDEGVLPELPPEENREDQRLRQNPRKARV